MQIFESEVFKLKLDIENTEPSGQRSVDLKRLHRFCIALLGRHVLEGTHVMEPVRQLDDKNSYVF